MPYTLNSFKSSIKKNASIFNALADISSARDAKIDWWNLVLRRDKWHKSAFKFLYRVAMKWIVTWLKIAGNNTYMEFELFSQYFLVFRACCLNSCLKEAWYNRLREAMKLSTFLHILTFWSFPLFYTFLITSVNCFMFLFIVNLPRNCEKSSSLWNVSHSERKEIQKCKTQQEFPEWKINFIASVDLQNKKIFWFPNAAFNM